MMDDDENDLDGLFEEYENDNEENVDNNNDGVNPSLPTENAVKVAAPRRAVKNPRLKFNADRLCGERGIPIVVKHFEDVKFKGKGHEVEDLNKLMSTLEHWCHRLYPSMKFEDCLRQIEKLGKKRPVQTCLRKIRLDMPILTDDFIHEEEPEERDIEPEMPPQDAFDKLINEIQSTSSAQLSSTPLPVKTSAPEQRLGSFGSTLTEEQRKRMEYNKMLATERRKAKFLAPQSSTAPSNKSEDLFTVRLTSTFSSSLNPKETSPTFDDIFSDSTSLLTPKFDKSHPVSSSEELELDDLVDLVNEDDEPELDDLVDLVNEDDEPSGIRSENNIFLEMNSQLNRQKGFIDLTNEGESREIEKNDTEIVDLEKEVDGNFEQNETIEVINLESKNSSTKVTTVVNLDPETSVNADKIIEVINLESQINNTKSITVVNLDSEAPISVSNNAEVINLESDDVDLINEKTVGESNLEIISTPIISTNVNKGDFDDKDEILGPPKSSETLQDDVESMEID